MSNTDISWHLLFLGCVTKSNIVNIKLTSNTDLNLIFILKQKQHLSNVNLTLYWRPVPARNKEERPSGISIAS